MKNFFDSAELAKMLGVKNTEVSRKIEVHRADLEQLGVVGYEFIIRVGSGSCGRYGARRKVYFLNAAQVDKLLTFFRISLDQNQIKWLNDRGVENPKTQAPIVYRELPEKPVDINSVDLAIALSMPHAQVIACIKYNRGMLEKDDEPIDIYPGSKIVPTSTGGIRKQYYSSVASLSLRQSLKVIAKLRVSISLNKKIALNKLGINTDLLSSSGVEVKFPPRYSIHDDISSDQKRLLVRSKHPKFEMRDSLIDLCNRRGLRIEIYPEFVIIYQGTRSVFTGSIDRAIAWFGVPDTVKRKAAEWIESMREKMRVS